MSERTRTTLIASASGLAGLVLGVVLTLVWVGPGQGEYRGPGTKVWGPGYGPGRRAHRTQGHAADQEPEAHHDEADTGQLDQGRSEDEVAPHSQPRGGTVVTSVTTERGLRLGPGEWVPTTQVRFECEGHAFNPVFSPDGRWLAFEVIRYAGDIDLFLLDTESGQTPQIRLPGGSSLFGGGNQVAVNPTWHPQGLMVFEGSNDSGFFRLYYTTPGGAAAAELLPRAKAPGDLIFPAISPDGNVVAYVSDETGNGDIRSWDRNTDRIRSYTMTAASEMFPAWSPSGWDLTFTRKEHGEEVLWLLEQSGQERLLADREEDQTRPAWVNDDTLVYFDGHRGEDQWDMVRVERDGSDVQVLVEGVRLPLRAEPAVSPDREWVGWAYDDPSRADSLWLLGLDGGERVELRTRIKGAGEPAFGLREGRVLLAWTGLASSQADWRELYFADVTDAVE